jgi:uncharacterized protein YukJ
MKFQLKIIFILSLLFFVTYKIIVAMDSKEKDDSVFNQVKENFSVSLPERTEDISYQVTSKMTMSSHGMFDNSCSMLH